MTSLKRILWLASYPKSGNTWMRSLLAHYFMPEGMAPDINNLRKFTTSDTRQDIFDTAAGRPYKGSSVEDWLNMRTRVVRMIAGSKPNTHFVKTHSQPIILNGHHLIPPEVTAGAIYILRNPFDVAPSYARHASADLDTAIDRMLHPDNMMGTPTGIYDALGRWDDHVKAWTGAPGLPLHAVRYEDLIEKPARTMRALLKDFLKVPIDQPKLARAIKATSFANMKKQEETQGFFEKPAGMKSFFAKGQVGAWQEDLTPVQVARVRDEFAPVLEQWYPEILRDVERYLKTAC